MYFILSFYFSFSSSSALKDQLHSLVVSSSFSSSFRFLSHSFALSMAFSHLVEVLFFALRPILIYDVFSPPHSTIGTHNL